MDLYAYAQIGDLEGIAKENGISVPRLRGYRLMANQKPNTQEDIEDILTIAELRICEDGCESIPRFSTTPFCYEYGPRTRQLKKKYLIYDDTNHLIGFRWDRLHGKNRRNLRFAVKKAKKKYLESVKAWNRYAGDPSVLYIHARIGGMNWLAYDGDKISKQPWFIEKVDDPYDDTYCDIYARIKPVSKEKDDECEEKN